LVSPFLQACTSTLVETVPIIKALMDLRLSMVNSFSLLAAQLYVSYI
jgi:hypothetical protein